VAHQHARVLEDPAPIASFEGFGDNTLNLMLRCYMPNLDGRIGVVTELHSEVDAAFGEAGIEIALPQREVHIDAAVPLEVLVLLERARGRRLQDSVRNATE
jgi:potassium efflux system protein